MEPSLLITFVVIGEIYAVFCFIGTFVFCAIIVLLTLNLAGFWLQVTTLTTIRSIDTDFYYFRTEYIGIVPQDIVIWVYMSLQCALVVPNEILCNTKFFFHSFEMMIVIMISYFSLIFSE